MLDLVILSYNKLNLAKVCYLCETLLKMVILNYIKLKLTKLGYNKLNLVKFKLY